MSQHCYHCQQPIPAGTAITDDDDRQYCCHACQAVAAIIQDSNLAGYYTTRTAPAPKPAAASALRFEAYAIPEIAAQYVYKTGGGNEIHLFIDGIHCGACSWLIASHLKKRLGLTEVRVNAATARAEVHYPDSVALPDILTAIAELGYQPNLYTPQENERRQNAVRNTYLLRLIVAGLGMMQVMMFATGLYTGEHAGMDREFSQLLRWISFGITTPVFFYSGWPFLAGAWQGLRRKSVNMDLPIAIAAAGAYFASVYHTVKGAGEIYFDSVTMLLFFLSISRFVEFLTRRRAQLNEIHFAKLLPEAVEKRTAGTWQLTPLTAIAAGDEIRVLPAQTIAIDGIITEGQSRADEAMLTGESTAVIKRQGDTVYAGSHNLESPITVKVAAAGQETVLAGIRRLMQKAGQHKSAVLSTSETLARATIAGVLALALAAYLLWQFIEPAKAFEIALAVLVATCPCALSLAVPAALTAAINHANRHGILIKQSDSLDKLLKIKHILFDKTGTLTEGSYRLTAQQFYQDAPAFLWQIAKSLQRHSPHPIAWAFLQQSDLPELALENVRQMTGAGVSASYQGRRWFIGSRQGARQQFPDIDLPEPPPAETPNTAHVYLLSDTGTAAIFNLADPLRPEMPSAIQALSAYQLHAASGDTAKNVESTAAALSITDWHAGCTPEDKIDILQALKEPALMIGDGINDGPAMAAAALSVAVGKANPLSQTQADIVLLTRGPEALPYLFRLAERTRAIVRQNFVWAIVYNLTVLPLAVCGYLTPWIAAIGMSASSLIVVFNAMRISRTQAPAAPSAPAPIAP